jgi:hypothetical protein
MGVGAAALGAIVASRLDAFGAAASPSVQAEPGPSGLALDEPLVVHLRDAATAEVVVMLGTREIVYRDPDLVARLLAAVGRTAGAEG